MQSLCMRPTTSAKCTQDSRIETREARDRQLGLIVINRSRPGGGRQFLRSDDRIHELLP